MIVVVWHKVFHCKNDFFSNLNVLLLLIFYANVSLALFIDHYQLFNIALPCIDYI